LVSDLAVGSKSNDKAAIGFSRPNLSRNWKKFLRVVLGADTMNEPGKALFILDLIIASVGLLIWSGFGKDWLGRLPGDIHYSKGNFSFHFPISTCLLI